MKLVQWLRLLTLVPANGVQFLANLPFPHVLKKRSATVLPVFWSESKMPDASLVYWITMLNQAHFNVFKHVLMFVFLGSVVYKYRYQPQNAIRMRYIGYESIRTLTRNRMLRVDAAVWVDEQSFIYLFSGSRVGWIACCCSNANCKPLTNVQKKCCKYVVLPAIIVMLY